MRRSTSSFLALLLFITRIGGTSATAATVVAQVGDASVAHDTAAGTWTLGAGSAALTLAVVPALDFAFVALISASGREWMSAAAADTFVRVGGRTLAFGHRSVGFEYQN